MFDCLIHFIRDQYSTNDAIPLHAPVFIGHERQYVTDTIDSTFVSSVGVYVDRFERDIASYTGSSCAIATVNGTAALHVALRLAGVCFGDLVITQSMTFVATCNAIAYANADPVFVDVDRETLGLSPKALEAWLHDNAKMDSEGICRTKAHNKIIRACVPMHTFGHPVELDGLMAICDEWNIAIVEDAAESLGSFYKNRHAGTFGRLSALSFNGNKIMTTGGGGMILTDESLGSHARHLTTTAKKPHPYAYEHDEIGYNYRMPNINAALGCAQLEQMKLYLRAKRVLAERYAEQLKGSDLKFVSEPPNCRSNYWLNAVVCESRSQRDDLLKSMNDRGIMVRPVWELMHRLPMYKNCRKGELHNSEWFEERIVNLPSSVLPEFLP